MKWYPLTTAQIIILIFLITIADLYTVSQRLIFPETLRLFIYLFFLTFSLLGFFFFVKPDEPMALAKTLSVILCFATLILVLIQNVIVTQSVSWRTGILLLGAVVAPVAAGYCYPIIYPRHRK
jgi:uncharacterized membrane protein